MPACSLTVYVREVHGGGIMGHSGVANTLSSSQRHIYCPRMMLDVERLHGQCVVFKQAKSKANFTVCILIYIFLLHHGLIFP